MYHIAHIAPNQEQSEVLQSLAKTLDLLGKSPHFIKVDNVTKLRELLRKREVNMILMSTQYTQKQLLERLDIVLTYCRSIHSIVPLIYDVEWNERLPNLLGTPWGGRVGILHSFSTRNEIMATLTRLGQVLEDVDEDPYQILGSLRKRGRP